MIQILNRLRNWCFVSNMIILHSCPLLPTKCLTYYYTLIVNPFRINFGGFGANVSFFEYSIQQIHDKLDVIKLKITIGMGKLFHWPQRAHHWASINTIWLNSCIHTSVSVTIWKRVQMLFKVRNESKQNVHKWC